MSDFVTSSPPPSLPAPARPRLASDVATAARPVAAACCSYAKREGDEKWPLGRIDEGRKEIMERERGKEEDKAVEVGPTRDCLQNVHPERSVAEEFYRIVFSETF